MKKSILCLVVLFSFCVFAQDSATKQWKAVLDKTAILKAADSRLGDNAKLSRQDLADVAQLLMKCIMTSNSVRDTKDAQHLSSLENYNRQYIPFTKDGQKFVLVNCFCDDVKHFPKWKKEVVTVYDGGGCYFTVLINLTKKEYSNLSINGIA